MTLKYQSNFCVYSRDKYIRQRKSFFISQNSALAMTRKRNDSSEICQLNEMYNRWFLNVDVKEIPSIEVLSFYWCAAAFILVFSLLPIQKRSHLAILPISFFWIACFFFMFHDSITKVTKYQKVLNKMKEKLKNQYKQEKKNKIHKIKPKKNVALYEECECIWIAPAAIQ